MYKMRLLLLQFSNIGAVCTKSLPLVHCSSRPSTTSWSAWWLQCWRCSGRNIQTRRTWGGLSLLTKPRISDCVIWWQMLQWVSIPLGTTAYSIAILLLILPPFCSQSTADSATILLLILLSFHYCSTTILLLFYFWVHSCHSSALSWSNEVLVLAQENLHPLTFPFYT